MPQESKIRLPRAKEGKVFNFPLKNYVLGFISANLLFILIVWALKSKLPPEVPLYYGLAEGEEQLGPTWALTIPNLIALAFLGLNLLISLTVKDSFLKRVLVITGFVVTFFSAITVIKIVILIGSF